MLSMILKYQVYIFINALLIKLVGMIGLVIAGNDQNNLEQIKKANLRGKSKKSA